MTRYHVRITLTCPSDWTVESCEEYMRRILTTEEERASLEVIAVAEDFSAHVITSVRLQCDACRVESWCHITTIIERGSLTVKGLCENCCPTCGGK